MDMFARFDENPAMTLDIKETKRYIQTDGRTHGRMDGQRENSIPTKTKFAGGGYNNAWQPRRGGGNLSVILVRTCWPVFFKPTQIIYPFFEKMTYSYT